MIGFLNVYKPQGMSSAAVVGKIKKKFNLKKVGHMGTLDPLACGVLPIAVGKATKMFDYFLNKKKTYIVNCEFGYETSSLDLGTEKINETTFVPTLEDVVKATKSFLGKIKQQPPIYSAKKIDGKKAYELARDGKDVVLKDVEVEIFKFDCLSQINNTTFKFEIECSSGTYVRSLIRDLAYKLNTYATVVFLERTKTDFFDATNAIKLDDLLSSNINLENVLIKIEQTFKNIKQVQVDNLQFDKLKNGLIIKTNLSDENNVFIVYDNQLLGVAEIKNKQIKLKTYLLED